MQNAAQFNQDDMSASTADHGHADKYRALDEMSDVASSAMGGSQHGSVGDGKDESETSKNSMGSATALRNLRHLRTTRKRIPGGAAAKLIGRSVDAEDGSRLVEQYISDDGGMEVVAPTDELDSIRQKAKEEFKIGTQSNRRYHTPQQRRPDPTIERTMSEVSLPSILNRSEVFHESAAAAVVSLLSPRSNRAMSDAGSVAGAASVFSVQSPDRTPRSPPLSPPRSPFKEPLSSAFQPPPKRDDGVSVVSCGTAPSSMVGGPGDDDNNFERFDTPRSPTEQPLLTPKAEKRVEEMASNMKDPSKKLSDLLSAIASPEDRNLDRGYMVRRKNACGALQVLTAKKIHRVKICWTLGVLPALTSVLEDAGDEGLEVAYPDIRTRLEYIEARKRAIASLMNLSMPPENRLAVFHSPQLVSSVVQVIIDDDEESRRGCCAVLAYLGKTPENRILMVQVPGLIDAITGVIKPKPARDDDESSAGSGSHTDDEPGFGASTSGTVSGTASGEATDHNESFFSEEEKENGSTVESSTFGTSPTETLGEAAARYDNDPNEFLHGARQNIFALLFHLVKEKDNAFHLVRHNGLTDTLVEISKLHESPSHVFAVKLLAHLTRHRNNSKPIVFRLRNVVPALVNATFSEDDASRLYACYALQNLAQDKPCRQELAITQNLLSALCYVARQGNTPEERLAAIRALKNLTDEPANLIPMSNTPECFATFMQIAHASDDSITETMQYLGCDALATLSHWFRSIATSGQRMEALKLKQTPSKELFVPSLKIVSWQQWQ